MHLGILSAGTEMGVIDLDFQGHLTIISNQETVFNIGLVYWFRAAKGCYTSQTCSCSKSLTLRCPSKLKSLLWRHNGRDSVSNHQPHDCLLNRLFRRSSKKTSKLRVTGLCAGNSPGTSNAEKVSIWWRHQVLPHKREESACPTVDYMGDDDWLAMQRTVASANVVLNQFSQKMFVLYIQKCKHVIAAAIHHLMPKQQQNFPADPSMRRVTLCSLCALVRCQVTSNHLKFRIKTSLQ